MAPNLRLHYFDFPGRAELTRIILNYGGIPFEDVLIDRDSWPSIKPNMPFGQVPVLEVDGKMVAQSAAIERYAATLAGLMPSDPLQVAKADEVISYLEEINGVFRPTFTIKDPDEKIKARQELCAGALKEKFDKLAGLLEANGGKYFVDKSLTFADLAVYSALAFTVSGFWDGVPKTYLDQFPTLKAQHNRIAALPKLAERYAKAEGLRIAYKQLS